MSIETAEYAVYRYNAENNKFGFTDKVVRKISDLDSFFSIVLLLPLISTLFIECALAVVFYIDPLRHVFVINAITNPIMNVVLILLYDKSTIDLIFVILIVEIVVAFFEYLYYINKYKKIRKRKLLIFSIVANISSWLIYWGVTTMF